MNIHKYLYDSIIAEQEPLSLIDTIRETNLELLSDQELEELCRLIENSDKGIVDSVSGLLISQPSPEAAEKLTPYISSENINIRNLAGDILLRMGFASVEPLLLKFVTEKDPDNLKFMIDILGLIGDDSAAPVIESFLCSSLNENVLIACIEALGNLKYESSSELLINLYGSNELFQPVIIEALGKIITVSEEASTQLLQFFYEAYNSPDDIIKFAVIESLGNTGNEDTFHFLLNKIGMIDGALAWQLLTSLYTLKTKYELSIPFSVELKNVLISAVNDASLNHRITAALIAADFDDRDLKCLLLKVYGDDQELDERITSVFFVQSNEMLAVLAHFFMSSPSNVKALLILLKEVIDNDYYPADNYDNDLIRQLSDSVLNFIQSSDEETRRVVYEILFKLDTDKALKNLSLMSGDENIWNCLTLLDLVENIFTTETDKLLLDFSSAGDEMISERADYLLNLRSPFLHHLELHK